MTFDELCKAVKKANKDAEVKYGKDETVVSVANKVIAVIDEYTGRGEFAIEREPACEVDGGKEIVWASIEYANTKLKDRATEPMWFIELKDLEFKRLDTGETKKTTAKGINLGTWEDEKHGNSGASWGRWGIEPLLKSEIKNYLSEVYGEEKADEYIDTFIEMFGTRAQ